MLPLHMVISHIHTHAHSLTMVPLGCLPTLITGLTMLWDCVHVTLSQHSKGIESEGEMEGGGLILDAWHVELR